MEASETNMWERGVEDNVSPEFVRDLLANVLPGTQQQVEKQGGSLTAHATAALDQLQTSDFLSYIAWKIGFDDYQPFTLELGG
jgi:hypothetical protein